MKEQLAAMTIIELVTTAHSYATSIQQIDTHSAIVREMASRLEALNLAHIGGMNSLRSATSTIDQLAAEASYLRGEIKQHSQSTHFCDVCGKDDPCITDDICMALDNTPATDAWQREQMAKGVEMAAALYHPLVVTGGSDDPQENGLCIREDLLSIARKLRVGEDV